MSELPLSEEHSISIAGTVHSQPATQEILETEPQRMRRQLAADPHRPCFHFLPPANWLNDPNGLIQWNGQYHLFYQYNPAGPYHGLIHWGHAVSDDLVHWRDLPVALTPSPDGWDCDGCWSGCAVNNDGVPTLIYSGVFPQAVCLATSADGMHTWQKYEHNPVIGGIPDGIDAGNPWDFRDPFVWREAGTWYMLIGTRIVDVGGAVLLYRSPDLRQWEYLNPFLVGNKAQQAPYPTGTVWECPNLLPLGDRHLFIVSYQNQETKHLLYSGYYVGTYRDHRFEPEQPGILDYGGHFYAPQVMRDEQGRWLMWGWLWEGRTPEAQLDAGWAGVLSLPRQLFLHADGRLGILPAPELESLRQQHWQMSPNELRPADGEVLLGVQEDCLELIVELEPAGASAFGLVLRRSPDKEEYTTVLCNFEDGTVTVDRSHAGSATNHKPLSPGHEVVRYAPLELSEGEPLRLHLFLDRSVIELFVNERTTFSTRIYPSRPDSHGIGILAQGGSVIIKSLDVWTMKSIWMREGDE